MGIRVEREIAAARDAVWEVLADLAGHPTWMKDALAIEFATDQTSGVGTRMTVPTKIGPFRTTDLMFVTEWDPPNSMGVVHEGVVSGSGRFSLEGDSPTAIVWTETLAFPWWLGGSLTAILARPILRWVWRGNLKGLASLIENEKNPT